MNTTRRSPEPLSRLNQMLKLYPEGKIPYYALNQLTINELATLFERAGLPLTGLYNKNDYVITYMLEQQNYLDNDRIARRFVTRRYEPLPEYIQMRQTRPY